MRRCSPWCLGVATGLTYANIWYGVSLADSDWLHGSEHPHPSGLALEMNQEARDERESGARRIVARYSTKTNSWQDDSCRGMYFLHDASLRDHSPRALIKSTIKQQSSNKQINNN
jgi:hypothetical protein